MSKRKNKKSSIANEPNLTHKNQLQSILYFLIMLIFNIVLINRITSNNIYTAYHTGLQLLAYILIYNLSFLIFYNYLFPTFKKKTTLYLYIGIGISILYIYIISFYPVLELNGDNAGYLSRAQSMLSGKGFRNIWLPNEPFDATLKSIGFSILNIPFILIFGLNNYIGLKLLEFLSVFVGFFFMYKYFENKLKKYQLFLLVILVATYSQIIHFSSIIMTESVAFALLFLIMYLLEKYIDNTTPLNIKKILGILGIAFLLVYTFTTREAMFALLGAVPLYLLIKKRWKEFFLLSFFIGIFFGGYLLYSRHLKSLNQSLHLIQNITAGKDNNPSILTFIFGKLEHSGLRLKTIWTTLLVLSQKIKGNPDIGQYKNIFGNIIILFIFSTGIFIRIKKKLSLHIYDLFAIILPIIVMISWSASIDAVVFSRYYYPLIPFIFYLFILGLQPIEDFLQKFHFQYLLPLIIFSFFLIFSSTMNTKEVYSAKHHYAPAVQHFIDACHWIDKNLPQNIIIANRKSTLAYIWAHRKSMHYFNDKLYTRYDPFSNKFEEDTLKYYKDNHIQYIILDAFSYDAYNKILPIIKNNMEEFKVIYATQKPQTYVLQVLRN